MINSRKILPGVSDQVVLNSGVETLKEKGLTFHPDATRFSLSFDLDQASPLNIDIIGRLTKDGQTPTDTYGTQFQYGQLIELSLDQALNWKFVKITTGPDVNFMVDQYKVEQHRG